MKITSNFPLHARKRGSFFTKLVVLFGWGFPLVLSETFKLGFLPALAGYRGQENRHKYHVGAFVHALKHANEDILGPMGHQLNFTFMDNRADTLVSIRAMTEMYNNDVIAFIGPENTCVTEARIAAAWNLPMIDFKCLDSEVSNKKLYPTFARTTPSTFKVTKSIISILNYFNWNHFTIVVGNSSKWLEAADTLRELTVKEGIMKQEDLPENKVFQEPFVSKDKNKEPPISQIVSQTAHKTRIYVLFGEHHSFIDFVRTVAKLENRADYVIISVDENEPNQKRDKYFLKYHEKKEEELHQSRLEAFKQVLILRPRKPNFTTEFEEKVKNYSVEVFNVTKPIAFVKNLIRIPVPAAYLYDAVVLYAKALKEVLLEKGIAKNGTAIFEKIKSRSFNSIQGFTMNIDENGDAETNYTIVSFGENEENGSSIVPMGHFTANSQAEIPTVEFDREINWILGEPPASKPKCGFDGELCQFKPDWPIAAVCIFAAFVILILTTFAVRHYLYEQKLMSLLWKIDYKDLIITSGSVHDNAGMSHSSTSDSRPKKKSYIGRFSFISSEDGSREEARIGASQYDGLFKIASFKGQVVAVIFLKKKHVEITRNVRKELHLLKEMSHDNITRFIGACADPGNICIVTQFCARGSLKDILENEDLHLDDMFIASLVFDLIKGMIYLHDSELGSHGNLKSSNCLVDSRWVLTISDFGLHNFKMAEVPTLMEEEKYYKRLLWKAPELLRDPYCPPQGTPKGDVYSFAIILYEIHGRAGPWGNTPYTAKEIVEKLKNPPENFILRPDTSFLKCENFIIKSIQECWQEDHESRPDFKFIRLRLKPMQRGLRSNIFDNMLAIMEKYANNLESIVAERTDQLVEEKKKTEALLLRMLPPSVAEQLKRGKPVIPEQYDWVTIYFSDIVGFTSISAESTPMQVVDMLNDLYTCFDSIIGEYDVYKVETIGDAYMVVSGLPLRNGDNHAGEIASMSLHLLKAIKSFKIRHRPEEKINLRIGVHIGPCVAGVVGLKMPRYCLFGDTVNTASRLESTGLPLRIHCSRDVKLMLDKLGGYLLEERGLVNMKGKGDMQTWWLVGEDTDYRLRRISVGQQDKPQSQPTTPNPASNGQLETSPLVPPVQDNKKILYLAKQCSTITVSSEDLSDASVDHDDVDTIGLLLNGNIPYYNNHGESKVPDPVFV